MSWGRSAVYAGLDLARLHQPDLVLCDVQMPGMSGFEFLEALRGEADLAQTPVMDEVLVSATRMELAYPLGSMTVGGDGIVRQRPYTSDSAGLLKDVPGFSSYAGGGVSSLPAIRSFADDRLRVEIDGMGLHSACGNHMNPPMSYIDPGNVGQIKVQSGITPVSSGGDSRRSRKRASS